MASIRVRIDDFEDGVYPDVCASSGATGGTRLYHVDISSQVRWVWLLVLGGPMGVLAALVLGAVLRTTASGYLPYTDAVQNRLRQRIRRYAQAIVASLVVIVGSFALTVSQSASFRGVAIVGIVGGTIGLLVFGFLWSNPPGSVGGHLDSTGRWIVLDPVSRNFADAYEQQEGRRRAVRRSEVEVEGSLDARYLDR